jgi:hypothetical protein
MPDDRDDLTSGQQLLNAALSLNEALEHIGFLYQSKDAAPLMEAAERWTRGEPH